MVKRGRCLFTNAELTIGDESGGLELSANILVDTILSAIVSTQSSPYQMAFRADNGPFCAREFIKVI